MRSRRRRNALLLRVALARLALILALTLALALATLTRPPVSVAPMRVALSGFCWMAADSERQDQRGACGRKSVESHVSLE